MKRYKLTFRGGWETTRQASDIRALLITIECVEQREEPIRIELVK